MNDRDSSDDPDVHDEILRHLDSNPPPKKPVRQKKTPPAKSKSNKAPTRPTIMLRHMTLEAALDRLERFLRQHHRHGTAELIVIVGKGSRSAGGESLLRPAVEEFCRQRPGLVRALREAAPAEGGSGAWIVELASR